METICLLKGECPLPLWTASLQVFDVIRDDLTPPIPFFNNKYQAINSCSRIVCSIAPLCNPNFILHYKYKSNYAYSLRQKNLTTLTIFFSRPGSNPTISQPFLVYLDHHPHVSFFSPRRTVSRQLWKAKAKPCDEFLGGDGKDRMRPWSPLSYCS